MYFTVDKAQRHRLPLYKTVLCVTCALILIVNGISLFHNLQSLRGANFLQSQSSRVADRLQYLNVLVLDAESSMRAYFLSGNDAYLGPTRSAVPDSEKEFTELERLLADNPIQLKNLSQLHTLVRRRLATLSQALDVYRAGGLDDIVAIAKVGGDRSSMDEIRLQVVIMEQEQNETMAARSAAFYHEYQKAVLLGMGVNAVAIVVLIMFYQLVRRSLKVRAAIEYALQSANETLESTVEQRTGQLSVLSRHLITISEEEKVRRIVENLRPSLLDNLGLCAAIESYCDEFSRLAQVRCETDIASDIASDSEHNGDLSIALFRIVQESLTNIRKYAKAAKVTVTLMRDEQGLVLRIIDDGIGIANDKLVKPMSHGLLGMRERALLLGGMLTIRRGRNDGGTCIEVRIPLRAATPAGPAAAQVSSAPRPPADGHIPSSQPYSTRPRSSPTLRDQ